MGVTRNIKTTEEQYMEDSFKLFGIFRMSWPDIKNLSEEDRQFLIKRADEVEEQAKKQASFLIGRAIAILPTQYLMPT